jgi:16S rRNA processing protein RimM
MELRVGCFGKPHGIKGEMLLWVDESIHWTPAAGCRVRGTDKRGAQAAWHITQARPFKNGFLVSLESIADRTQAEALTGCAIFAAIARLPAHTFLIKDLVGSLVKTADGRVLGTLAEVMATKANDVFRVTDEHRELLIPALKSVVKSFNKDTKELTVVLPDGLEDAH